jgi:glyoxylase-like metal-dependent hydrolase (beta-lactamase superfamily II)
VTGAARHPAYGQVRPVTPYASVVLAPNPSPMTLEGTNSWVLRAPGGRHSVVVDPGPDDPVHLATLAGTGPVALILLTHGHADHAAGAAGLHTRTGAPVRAADPAHRIDGAGLADGDVVTADGLDVTVLATPGHTADSVCLVVEDSVLTGDTILGRGTTVVAHPDGRLADYLDSLRRLAALGPRRVLPGHGPEQPDVAQVAAAYLAHRIERLDQVRAAVEAHPGAVTAGDIVDTVYADVDPAVRWAAELSVQAQLDYLASDLAGES